MAVVENGPPCHLFCVNLNPVKDNVRGSVRNNWSMCGEIDVLPPTPIGAPSQHYYFWCSMVGICNAHFTMEIDGLDSSVSDLHIGWIAGSRHGSEPWDNA